MNEMIEQYEEILNQIENRIRLLREQLGQPLKSKEHDRLCSRIALLEKECEELILNIHEMRTR